MNTDMKLQKVPVEKLKPAKYNPRKDLKPGDPAYEKIKRSMTTYGYVDPVIWNEVTGNIVGGHQRYKVLVAEGVKEIDCVVVHILWSPSAINANAYTGNLYLSYPACFLRTMLPNFSGTQYAACYVVGTLNGSIFTPVEPLLTSAIPTEEDGYTYIALGLLCTLYQLMLIPEHTLYRFVDGAFKPLSQIGYEAYTPAFGSITAMWTQMAIPWLPGEAGICARQTRALLLQTKIGCECASAR